MSNDVIDLPQETINFTLRSEINKNTGKTGYLVTTDKNPYIMVWRETKLEAVAIAMTRYLERLDEIENPRPKDETAKPKLEPHTGLTIAGNLKLIDSDKV